MKIIPDIDWADFMDYYDPNWTDRFNDASYAADAYEQLDQEGFKKALEEYIASE